MALVGYLAGWLLREVPLVRISGILKSNGGFLMALVLTMSSVAGAFASFFSTERFQWNSVLLVVAAAIVLSRFRRRLTAPFWIVVLALFLYTSNANAWWLSAIGDEYAFFFRAREIVDKQNLFVIGSQLFSGQAVYGSHPYLSSLLQAAFMELLGVNGFAWRFSNMFLSALAAGLFFVFFREFVARRTAVIASILLAESHYIMSFSKIGYNNLQALFAMALALWVATWTVRTQRPFAFAALGTALGFCFYVYPAALYVVPIPILLVLFFYPPSSGNAVLRWATMVGSTLAMVFPLLLQPEYLRTKIAGTMFFTPKLVQSADLSAFHMVSNLLYAIFSYLYTPAEDHFVAVSYVDPLTAAFVTIGIAVMLGAATRARFAAFFLLSLALLVLLVGASHDRTFPPTTRMFLLLPWFALGGAVGLEWMVRRAQDLGVPEPAGRGLMAIVLVAVLGLNLYQAYPLARDRMDGLQSMETLLLRVMQHAPQPTEVQSVKTYAFLVDASWGIQGIRLIPQVYPVTAQFVQVNITGPALPPSATSVLAEPDTVVIMSPRMDPAWERAIEPSIRAIGKSPCDIKTTTGTVRFKLWHSSGQDWACR